MFALCFAWLVGCGKGGVVLKAHMLHVIAVVSSFTDTYTILFFHILDSRFSNVCFKALKL